MPILKRRPSILLLSLLITNALLLNGCQITRSISKGISNHLVGPIHKLRDWDVPSDIHKDLLNLPPSQGKIVTAVYGFRDQSGQYKPPPSSSFSTAVTQGASAMLIGALDDSGWFVPVEREGLQNILTERKIIRAKLKKSQPNADLNPLLGANIIIEGGIIAYDTDIRTGGVGAKYFGIGSSEQYRVDQVTISLRAVDIYSGKIVNSVSVTKSILSLQVNFGVFRFVKFKRLLELETGFTRNEPTQVIVLDAIESAVIRLIVTGIHKRNWALQNASDLNHEVIKAYSNDHWLSNSPSVLEAPVQQAKKQVPQSIEPQRNKENSNPGGANQPSSRQPNQQSNQQSNQQKDRRNAEQGMPANTNRANSSPSNSSPSNSSPSNSNPSNNNPSTTASQARPPPQNLRGQSPAKKLKAPSQAAPQPTIMFYTIQLVATTNKQAIAPFIVQNGLNINQINYIEFNKSGKTWHAATIGKFTSKQAARNALNNLPAQLKTYQPWIRKMQTLSIL